MGNVVFCRDSEKVSLSLLVPIDQWPLISSRLGALGLTYKSEKMIANPVLGNYVKLRDIEGRGDLITELIFQLSDWYDTASNVSNSKIYIMVNTKKGRKNARKIRKEARARGESGDSGETDSAAGYGQAD